MTSLDRTPGRIARRDERGVVLFVAIIVLIVMSLAGLALMRQMGAGVSIAGNVAFKENATAVADRGVEEARSWIRANPNLLNAHQAAFGYFATWGALVDPAQFDWANSSRVLATQDANTGNETRYIIHRLCANVGPPNVIGQDCSDGSPLNSGATQGGGHYGTPSFTPPPVPFYRVTARVTGPRNTVSFVQVIMGN